MVTVTDPNGVQLLSRDVADKVSCLPLAKTGLLASLELH